MNLKIMQKELAVHQKYIDCLKAAIDWHSQQVADLTAAIQEAERERLVMTPSGPIIAPELPVEQPITRDEMVAVVRRFREGDAPEQSETFGELSGD